LICWVSTFLSTKTSRLVLAVYRSTWHLFLALRLIDLGDHNSGKNRRRRFSSTSLLGNVTYSCDVKPMWNRVLVRQPGFQALSPLPQRRDSLGSRLALRMRVNFLFLDWTNRLDVKSQRHQIVTSFIYFFSFLLPGLATGGEHQPRTPYQLPGSHGSPTRNGRRDTK